uniref:Uncharacterized protein n=1 Tax=Cacopsylla melanoneura TaxID=428564 RepID=A0A8D8XH10_9HEMI
MTSIYKKKHPGRILPFHVWAPFIDVSEKSVFVVFYLFELFALVGLGIVIFGACALQVIVPTSLVGQYKMFAKFANMIGAEHKDSFGDRIFYTDVSKGTYLYESQLREYW